MPETIDWPALDACIARMVGFKQKASPIDGTLLWIANDEEEYLVGPRTQYAWAEWDVWQPHTDMAQALLVRDEIVKRGWCYSLNIDPADVTPQGKVVVAFYRSVPYTAFRARATTGAEAVCLAVEKWANANLDTTKKV